MSDSVEVSQESTYMDAIFGQLYLNCCPQYIRGEECHGRFISCRFYHCPAFLAKFKAYRIAREEKLKRQKRLEESSRSYADIARSADESGHFSPPSNGAFTAHLSLVPPQVIRGCFSVRDADRMEMARHGKDSATADETTQEQPSESLSPSPLASSETHGGRVSRFTDLWERLEKHDVEGRTDSGAEEESVDFHRDGIGHSPTRALSTSSRTSFTFHGGPGNDSSLEDENAEAKEIHGAVRDAPRDEKDLSKEALEAALEGETLVGNVYTLSTVEGAGEPGLNLRVRLPKSTIVRLASGSADGSVELRLLLSSYDDDAPSTASTLVASSREASPPRKSSTASTLVPCSREASPPQKSSTASTLVQSSEEASPPRICSPASESIESISSSEILSSDSRSMLLPGSYVPDAETKATANAIPDPPNKLIDYLGPDLNSLPGFIKACFWFTVFDQCSHGNAHCRFIHDHFLQREIRSIHREFCRFFLLNIPCPTGCSLRHVDVVRYRLWEAREVFISETKALRKARKVEAAEIHNHHRGVQLARLAVARFEGNWQVNTDMARPVMDGQRRTLGGFGVTHSGEGNRGTSPPPDLESLDHWPTLGAGSGSGAQQDKGSPRGEAHRGAGFSVVFSDGLNSGLSYPPGLGPFGHRPMPSAGSNFGARQDEISAMVEASRDAATVTQLPQQAQLLALPAFGGNSIWSQSGGDQSEWPHWGDLPSSRFEEISE